MHSEEFSSFQIAKAPSFLKTKVFSEGLLPLFCHTIFSRIHGNTSPPEGGGRTLQAQEAGQMMTLHQLDRVMVC